MNELVSALNRRISELDDEIDELTSSLTRAQERKGMYLELLRAEEGLISTSSPVDKPPTEEPAVKRKRGRPSSKPVVVATKDAGLAQANLEDFNEAIRTMPGGVTTTPEEQAKAIARYNPAPRPSTSYGGVRVGGKKDIHPRSPAFDTNKPGHTSVSIEEE